MSKRNALSTVIGGRVVPLYVELVEPCGGINPALVVAQAAFWQGRVGRPFYKSREEWGEETGLTRRELETARKKLKDRGLLTERTEHLPTRVYFWIDFDKLVGMIESARPSVGIRPTVGANEPDRRAESARLVQEKTPREDFKRDKPSCPDGHLFLEDSESEQGETPKPRGVDTTMPRSGPLIEAELAEFEAWYRSYPKRCAKGAAKAAWRKARRRFPAGQEGLAELIRLTDRWWSHRLATEGPDLTYVPGPGPWLNQERWADEAGSPEASADAVRRGVLERAAETERMLREQEGR